MPGRRQLRPGAALAAALTAGLALAGPAAAHVQVTPSQVATDDGVLFTVLVPNERDVATTSIDLQIPKGMLAYGVEDHAGWTYKTILAADQSIGRVRWTGRLPAGEFVRFSLLASTPDSPTTIAWKALQTYADGDVVRWIGAPGSESPASQTVVSFTTPRQSAGGEYGTGESGAAGPSGTGRASAAGSPAPAADRRGPDWLARGLSLAALLAALAALGATVRRRPAPLPTHPTTETP